MAVGKICADCWRVVLVSLPWTSGAACVFTLNTWCRSCLSPFLAFLAPGLLAFWAMQWSPRSSFSKMSSRLNLAVLLSHSPSYNPHQKRACPLFRRLCYCPGHTLYSSTRLGLYMSYQTSSSLTARQEPSMNTFSLFLFSSWGTSTTIYPSSAVWRCLRRPSFPHLLYRL